MRAALAAVALATAATGCSGTSTGARTAQAAARVRADQARVIAQQAGLSPAVQAFLARAAGATDVTYTVVYDQGGGQSTTVISRPPDRRIDVVGASGPGSTDRVVILGTNTFVCHLLGRHWTCLSGVTSAPGGPFTADAIGQTISALVQLSQTYDFSVSPRQMLGRAASCLSADQHSSAAAAATTTTSTTTGPASAATVGDHALICIAPSGVILRVEGSGAPLHATSYRESVPSGAFDLPARPTPALTTTTAFAP
jgi:hypothetical protein